MCLFTKQKGNFYGIGFVDSTPIIGCHPQRIYGHKLFKGLAEIGKTTKGWFYWLKLDLICNHHGELVSCQITLGNVDDRSPVAFTHHNKKIKH